MKAEPFFSWLILFAAQTALSLDWFKSWIPQLLSLVDGPWQEPPQQSRRASRTLQGMILAGQSNTACLTFVRQTWGISRSQGYRLLKKAWAQIKDDINRSGIDRQELLPWSIQTLMAAAGQAMQHKNPGAVVSAIRQLDHMTGTGYKSHRGQGVRRRS